MQIQIAGTVDHITSADIDAINGLYAQLIGQVVSPPVTKADIAATIEFSDLFLMRDETRAVRGMALLVAYRKPRGDEGRVEDVVVDEAYRGHGRAKALMNALIDRARERGLKTLFLTCRPHREAANRLYASLGFVPYETNPYRLDL